MFNSDRLRISGQRQLDVAAFLEYFAPLIKHLEKENKANCECYGWNQDWPKDVCLRPAWLAVSLSFLRL